MRPRKKFPRGDGYSQPTAAYHPKLRNSRRDLARLRFPLLLFLGLLIGAAIGYFGARWDWGEWGFLAIFPICIMAVLVAWYSRPLEASLKPPSEIRRQTSEKVPDLKVGDK